MRTYHSRTVLFFSLACIFSGAGEAMADEGKSVSFRFNPKDGTNFIQKVTVTSERNFNFMKAKAEDKSGKEADDGEIRAKDTQLDEAESKTKISINKKDEGWTITYEPQESAMKKDGEPMKNPAAAMFSNFSFTYHLDKEGKVTDVTGFEKIESIFASRFSAEKAKKFASMIQTDKIKETEISEWNKRIGDFIGKTVQVGDTWEKTMPVAMPNGEEISCAVKTHFQSLEECGQSKCVQIVQTFSGKDAKPADSEKNEEKSAKEGKKESNEAKEPMPAKSAMSLEGKLIRLVDPETMLIHKEESEKITTMEMEYLGREGVPTRITEKRRYEFEY